MNKTKIMPMQYGESKFKVTTFTILNQSFCLFECYFSCPSLIISQNRYNYDLFADKHIL